SAFSGRVGEAVVRVMRARAVRERYRPSGLKSRQGIERLYERIARQVLAGLARRLGEDHRGGPRMLRVDVERLELARVEVLHRAEVLPHGGVALVVVRRYERDERVRLAQLAVVRLLHVE